MKEKNTENYLDLVFVRNPKYKWDTDEDGEVTIYIENTGLFNRLAQKLLKKPKVSQLHLQGQGNYVWTLIDGERTVFDIGVKLKERFGDDAEPLYQRLVQYLKTLEDYGFIHHSKFT